MLKSNHNNLNFWGKAIPFFALLVMAILAFTFHFYEDSYFLKYIDDSPLIIVFIACGILLVLWVKDFVDHRFLQEKGTHHLSILFLFFLTLFFWIAVPLGTFQSGTIGNFIGVAILFYGSYFSMRFIISQLDDRFNFFTSQVYQFLFISPIVLLNLGIGKFIGQLFVAQSNIDRDGIEPFVILIFTLSFGIGNFLNNIRKQLVFLAGSEARADLAEKKALSTSAELKSLQSSINPHFLYNSLNSIASLATLDGHKTEKMALALSSFYQYVTNKKRDQETTLAAEMEMIENYLEIEKIRHGDRLEIIKDIAKETLHLKLPYFLLQPIVENAIKYGFADDSIKIKIKASINHGHLVLEISDDGNDFSENMESGYGLKSVTEKLQLLYPESHEITFANKPFKHVYILIKQNSGK